jgi:hypothetical protein
LETVWAREWVPLMEMAWVEPAWAMAWGIALGTAWVIALGTAWAQGWAALWGSSWDKESAAAWAAWSGLSSAGLCTEE